MHNLDPVIINYKNLLPEDQKIIQAKLSVLDLIKNARDEYKKDMKGKTALTRMLYDSAIETVDELETTIKAFIIMIMADMIDGYDYLIENQDTDDYFYGLESDMNEKSLMYLQR